MKVERSIGILFLLLLCTFAEAADKSWIKIENKLYSLELPSHWKPMEGMPGNGTEPGERDVNGFHLYYFAWWTPITDVKEIPNCIGIDIQTYEREDKTPLTLKEAEDIETTLSGGRFCSKTKTYSSKDKMRFVIVKDSKELDGSIVRYRVFYLLKQAGIRVHCAKIDLRDELFCREPHIEKMIERIFNSFKVNIK